MAMSLFSHGTAAFVAGWAASFGAWGAHVPPDTIHAAAFKHRLSTNEALGVVPLSTAIRATVGEPTVVHFRVASAAPFARTASVVASDSSVLRVIDAGQVPPDAKRGIAIVESLSAGTSLLTIAGATIEVTADSRRQVTAEQSNRIISPIEGAAVWGTVCISATWWRPDQLSDQPPSLRVTALDGRELARADEPTWMTTPASGPTALAAFTLDTAALPMGDVRLSLIWPGGERSPGSITVRVVHPDEALLVEGECEAAYELPPLPEDREEPKPNIRKDAKASGGAFFDNAGSRPRFRLPLNVPVENGPGWYQVVLTAGGDMAAATLPAVGVSVDESQYPVTRSAIAMPAFHRTSLGIPFHLVAGPHVLRLDFLNDFYAAGGADRNLRLDRIEVLRVADGRAGEKGAGGSEPAMMSAMTGAPSSSSDAMMSSMNGGARDEMMVAAPAGSEPADSPDGWPARAAARASRATPPIITFARSLDGAVVAGDLEVRGAAWWPGIGELGAAKRSGKPTPSASMLINGQPTARQYSAAPRFVVSADQLREGDNRLQLVLDGSDESVQSTEVRVRATGAGMRGSGTDLPAFQRFTIHDPRWSANTMSLWSNEQNPPERACFAMFSAAEAELNLPVNIEGDYELELEARGTAFQGAPEVAVTVIGEGAPSQLAGVLAVGGGWEPVTVLAGTPAEKNRKPAVVTFIAGGAKSLKLSFINDLYEPEKGDRNVFIQAVALRPRPSSAASSERDLPRADIVWPNDGECLRADGAAAIVIEPKGRAAARSAEVVIDGGATGQVVDLRSKLGPIVVPVSLRGITSGEHDLSVRLDGPGNQNITLAARRVRLVDAGDAALTRYERAITLLNRLAFGPDERELAAILTLGEGAYLEQRLGTGSDDGTVARAHQLASVRYPNSSNAGDVQRRALLEAIATDNPVRYRFVLFAQNHFSTWIRKTEARRKADEHEEFCTLGIAPFAQLLRASAMSPAMLRYLDQEQSFARRLNENYAREIMELHTLGVNGGYTQEDVTTLARMFTGWTTAREPFQSAEQFDGVGPDEYGMREVFRYDPVLADGEARTFLGRVFPAPSPVNRHDRVLTALGVLAGHPSTARFISSKLASHLVAFPPPEDLVDRIASTYERNNGDMRQVLQTVAFDPLLFATPARLAHPPDFGFRLARVTGSTDVNALHDYLNLSGHGMFDRSTPDGYPESDAEVTDSNAMLQRWKFARRLENSLFELIPAGRRYGDKPISDAEVQSTIDLLAMRITGRLLGSDSNAAALDLLGKTEGKRDARWRAAAVFIASTPEAQLR